VTRHQRSVLDEAIYAAVTFLLQARDERGHWSDFHLYPGASDEWVTAYVGSTLAALPGDCCAEAAQEAWRLLEERQRSDGRWGYNARTIGDGDSTSWGLRLAHAVGARGSEHVARARRALSEHLRPGGGVATYAAPDPIRDIIEAPEHMSFRGWCGAHPCVTAAAALLPDCAANACAHLRRVQREDGGFPSYWWHDPEYGVGLAAEALATARANGDAERVQRAIQWAGRRLDRGGFIATSDHPAGSPFASACGLWTLLCSDGAGDVRPAVLAASAWLLFQQRGDGSWMSSARLRVPWPDEEQPDRCTHWIYGGKKEGALVFDQRRVFTTATVVAALARVRSGSWRRA
jgi:hypothetical protein